MAAGDLCSRDEVREFLQTPTEDTDQNAVIDSLIIRASAAIQRYCDRQFAPTETAAAHSFEYDPAWFRGTEAWIDLAPFDVRSVSQVRIDTDETAVTLDTDLYRLYPVTARDGVYTAIRIDPLSFGYRRFRKRRVEITGDWGFATVPPAVKHAAIATVAEWLRRDVSAFSTTFNIDQGETVMPEAFPREARLVLDLFKRQVFA